MSSHVFQKISRTSETFAAIRTLEFACMSIPVTTQLLLG